jgi:hypothetical protein
MNRQPLIDAYNKLGCEKQKYKKMMRITQISLKGDLGKQLL